MLSYGIGAKKGYVKRSLYKGIVLMRCMIAVILITFTMRFRLLKSIILMWMKTYCMFFATRWLSSYYLYLSNEEYFVDMVNQPHYVLT